MCGSGRYVDGNCARPVKNNCPNNYNDLLLSDTVSYYRPHFGGCITSGYQVKQVSDYFYYETSGALLTSGGNLCGSGRYVDGVCTQSVQNDCPDNHNDLLLSNTFSYYRPHFGGCITSGYQKKQISDYFYYETSGALLTSGVDLCGGGRYVNGVCTRPVQNNCPDNYTDLLPSGTFLYYGQNFGGCTKSGYKKQTYPDNLKFIATGLELSPGIEICGSGRYVDGACTPSAQNDCPANYKDLQLGDTTFVKLNLGACSSGYHKYTMDQQCSASSTDAMCALLCSGDEIYTEIGGCSNICPYGATQLKIRKDENTIYSFALYETKQITPSINIGFGNGQVCYVNLLSGRQSGALNVNYNSTTYHSVN